MSLYLTIHPQNPQGRLINQAVTAVMRGGVMVYPTDSAYALGCCMGAKSALGRICNIRQLDEKHYFTLLCHSLSSLGTYAQVSNSAFRLIKSLIPGPYTFILKATREVPRRIMHPKRKTIGLRVPDNPITQALLEALGQPLMNTTLELPGANLPLCEPTDIYEALGKRVDVIIDGGYGGAQLTTVIDLTTDEPFVVREGAGSIQSLLPS